MIYVSPCSRVLVCKKYVCLTAVNYFADTDIPPSLAQLFRNYSNHGNQSKTDRPIFECKLCGKFFKNSNNLAVHERIHTGHRPFPCDMCEKRFTQRSTLLAHRRIHTGEKPYKCDFCGKAFAQKSTLNNHKATHLQMA